MQIRKRMWKIQKKRGGEKERERERKKGREGDEWSQKKTRKKLIFFIFSQVRIHYRLLNFKNKIK